jgi:hypothetical protein
LVFHLRSHRGCLPSALPPDLRIPHRSSGQFKKSLDLSIVDFNRWFQSFYNQAIVDLQSKETESLKKLWSSLEHFNWKNIFNQNVHFTFPPKAICSQTCTKKKKYLSFAMKKLIWSLFY